MKIENLNKAIEINKKIEQLERERSYLYDVFVEGISHIIFAEAVKQSHLSFTELNEIGAIEDVEKIVETIILKFDKRIEELTKEFESL